MGLATRTAKGAKGNIDDVNFHTKVLQRLSDRKRVFGNVAAVLVAHFTVAAIADDENNSVCVFAPVHWDELKAGADICALHPWVEKGRIQRAGQHGRVVGGSLDHFGR